MLGFGKGKVEIAVSKYNFSPGETIDGTVKLKLKKPIKAKELNIRLVCEEWTVQGGTRRSKSTIKIFDFKQPLDKEKIYPINPKDYPFKIKIPANVLARHPMHEGTLGRVVEAVHIFTGTRRSLKWYLKASLDIPWAIDVSKKVQVNIA